jgi:hypothetical protein
MDKKAGNALIFVGIPDGNGEQVGYADGLYFGRFLH